jgi:hypothetical protein
MKNLDDHSSVAKFSLVGRTVVLDALTAICILSSIGTAYQASGIQFAPIEILIFKFSAVDAGDACPIAFFDIAALYHEFIYYTMKRRLGVGETIVIAGAQLPKAAKIRVSNRFSWWLLVESLLLGGLGSVLSVELDDEPSNRLVSNVHIKEDARLRGRGHDHDSLSHRLQQQLFHKTPTLWRGPD